MIRDLNAFVPRLGEGGYSLPEAEQSAFNVSYWLREGVKKGTCSLKEFFLLKRLSRFLYKNIKIYKYKKYWGGWQSLVNRKRPLI